MSRPVFQRAYTFRGARVRVPTAAPLCYAWLKSLTSSPNTPIGIPTATNVNTSVRTRTLSTLSALGDVDMAAIDLRQRITKRKQTAQGNCSTNATVSARYCEG
ncbi:hypothetical protein QFZ94_000495 [Paraburkholderia sp. JPY465]